MSELKTKCNDSNVIDFINTIEHEVRKKDALEILNMMQQITGESPKMWGTSIIGFGILNYKYKSGREGVWFKCGFSPRKSKISMYLMGCDISKAQNLLDKLGKHKTGKGCLYINRLTDINQEVLKKLIKESFHHHPGFDH